nr:hypothetical protein [Tanacetum cinerariifolium]
MNLLNGSCNNCIYGDGKPIMCNECEGMVRGGFCLPCNLKAENSFIYYQNAYSFDDTSNNSNYLPQPQYENYLCNLCGNNSHDGYDCQQQFPLVYEQEPSYNQNYDDNYYPRESPSFPCCDNCGGSHETFQHQPMDQNVDFSGSGQIQTPQYPEIHPPSQEISDEVFQANHSTQYKENLENSLNSNQEKEGPPQDFDIRQLIREECCIEVSEESKQKMEDTILELVKICHQKELLCMHDNVDDLIKSALNSKLLSINSQRLDKEKKEVKNFVEQPTERGTRIIKSLQNFRVIHKSSTSLKNMSQISPVHAIVPILSTKEPEHSFSMGYEHFSTTLVTKLDEVAESSIKNLVPIQSECEVTSEDENNDDLTSSNDESLFEDDVTIKESKVYLNPFFDDDEINSDELESHVEYNFVESLSNHDHLEEISKPLMPIYIAKEEHIKREHAKYISRMEMLFTINPRTRATMNANTIVESIPSPLIPIQDNDSQRKEIDIVTNTDDVLPPGVKNDDDSEGEIDAVKELHVDNSISNAENELSDNEESDFNNTSVPRPPPKPPDDEFDFELDT